MPSRLRVHRRYNGSRLENDFHYVFFLGVGDGGRGFVQRESAGDQRAGIDLGFAEQADGFGEGAAAGADYRDFLYDDGPSLDGSCAVEGGFEDQAAAGLGDLLS